MHDLFYVIIYKTSDPNKFTADERIKCIADRKSAFDIWYTYRQKGFKHIDVRNCELGYEIDFEHGMWGETKPL